MKAYGIYIDIKNSEQMRWWTNIKRLVKPVGYNCVVDTETKQIVGRIEVFQGPFARIAATIFTKKFISDPKELKLKLDTDKMYF